MKYYPACKEVIKDLISVLGYFACWVTLHAFLSSALFSKLDFFKNSFRNTIGMSNSLDSHQVQHFVGPGLGSNCLQRLAADAKTNSYLSGDTFYLNFPIGNFPVYVLAND